MIILNKSMLNMKFKDIYGGDCDNEETVSEFIRSSELEFGMEARNLEELTEDEFYHYVEFLDELWFK